MRGASKLSATGHRCVPPSRAKGAKDIARPNEEHPMRSKPKASRLSVRFIAVPLAAGAVLLGFGACGGAGEAKLAEHDVPTECMSYAAKYRTCLAKIGGPEVANVRAAAMEDGF